MASRKRKKPLEKLISLAPLDFESAIRAALQVRPPDATKGKPKKRKAKK